MLTLDDLGQVVEEILDVSVHWYSLGLQLMVRSSKLDSIQVQFSESKRQLLEMLKTWLTTSDNTSWKTLTDAVKSRSVEACTLACALETKYCLRMETEVDSGTFISDNQPNSDITSPPAVTEKVVPTLQPGLLHMWEGK